MTKLGLLILVIPAYFSSEIWQPCPGRQSTKIMF